MEWFIIGRRPYEVMIDPDLAWIRSASGIHSLEVQDTEANLARPVAGDGRVKAPIPGQITRMCVAAGDEVELGDPLLVLEAMKMENEIRAPLGGRVKALKVVQGQRVALHELLVEIE
jgi:biotin carboxyl carrier protein